MKWTLILSYFLMTHADAETQINESPDNIDASYTIQIPDGDVGVITAYIDKNHQLSHEFSLINPSQNSLYTSLGIGSSFKVSPAITAYGVIGAAADGRSSHTTSLPIQALSLDENSRMYGVGMSIRPDSDWLIDVKYQNANIEAETTRGRRVNFFNLGVGYQFW